MPHIRLEYSSDIAHVIDFRKLALDVLWEISQNVTTDLTKWRASLLPAGEHVFGLDISQDAFIHVEVVDFPDQYHSENLIPGAVLNVVREAVKDVVIGRTVRVTVEVRHIAPEGYIEDVVFAMPGQDV